MGGSASKSKPGQQGNLSTAAPLAKSAPCLPPSHKKELPYLILTFLAGVLLTLLIMALVFFIVKRFRKCVSRSRDPHSDSPTKLSVTPEESLNYVSMTFKPSEAQSNHQTENHFSDLDPVVYAQINVIN